MLMSVEKWILMDLDNYSFTNELGSKSNILNRLLLSIVMCYIILLSFLYNFVNGILIVILITI